MAVVCGSRVRRSSGRSQTQSVRAGRVFIRPNGGVRLAVSGLSARQRMQSGIKLSDFRSGVNMVMASSKMNVIACYVKRA
jgi:hypothetical protein